MVRAGKADVMFLDLNMPVMDGYQTMQVINDENLPSIVIVVSGDVQPNARARMMALGALEFIRKPTNNAKLVELLTKFGLYSGEASANKRAAAFKASTEYSRIEKLDAYREMANVAMGQAGERLANLLGEFIDLPIPHVNLITDTELHTTKANIKGYSSVSVVSQGFISAGIYGEALVVFNDPNLANMFKLLKYTDQENSHYLELEALMDVSNILIGACLCSLSDQLRTVFSQNHPTILGRHCYLGNIFKNVTRSKKNMLAIEITYSIKSQDISFDLLLLFPHKSIDLVLDKLVTSDF
jgi:chemotaxis protein CheY-P-specific phosphatase CheC